MQIQYDKRLWWRPKRNCVTIVLCWHLLERCNDVSIVADIDLKLCLRHQDALALQNSSRFLPAVAQLQQRPQSRAVAGSTGGRRDVHGAHPLQRPQRHGGDRSCFLHCNTKARQGRCSRSPKETDTLPLLCFRRRLRKDFILSWR